MTASDFAEWLMFRLFFTRRTWTVIFVIYLIYLKGIPWFVSSRTSLLKVVREDTHHGYANIGERDSGSPALKLWRYRSACAEATADRFGSAEKQLVVLKKP